ncbi:MAG: hypothetical protein ACRDGI_02405 [Candidatus Limnocylindrales bacterium]
MTIDRLAEESGTTPGHVRSLIAAGALNAQPDGLHDVEDIPRVRLALALADGGIDLAQLISVVRSGTLQLDWVARLWAVPEASGRTYLEFADSLGERASMLPLLYAAFGLAVPAPETVMRRDEEEAIEAFVELWSMVEDRPDVYLRAARVVGEGVRRIQSATQDLFDELGGPPGLRLQRGMTPDDAIKPAMRLGPVISQLLVWLQRRHQETEVFGRIVTYVEDALAGTPTGGNREEPPAIAFVDLSGYTELTVAAGDQRAAEFATSLQELAESSAQRHRGRVVKLLGDGVMLRFPAALDAIEGVRALISAIVGSALPPAHAGIAAGPFVVRDAMSMGTP